MNKLYTDVSDEYDFYNIDHVFLGDSYAQSLSIHIMTRDGKKRCVALSLELFDHLLKLRGY